MMLATVFNLLLGSACLPATVKADKKVSNDLIQYMQLTRLYNNLYLTLENDMLAMLLKFNQNSSFLFYEDTPKKCLNTILI